MRLLNAAKYQLEEFLESQIPPYAILSHTWGEDEVLCRDIQDLQIALYKAGFAKIAWTCAQAVRENLAYVWIDTCCIDKSSSAELQECVNSMYKYYAKAEVCYAYLEDAGRLHYNVHKLLVAHRKTPELDAALHTALSDCKWFSRGWTLQELIAPQYMKFFGSQWEFIGERSALMPWLSYITRIDAQILEKRAPLSSVSVAQRMSWAANRQTSRTEDLAYCLLGLFEVSIPMLYGEGSRSFARLQEEIMRTSIDHSIFAWGFKADRKTYDLLATAPSDFEGCDDVVSWGGPGQFEMSNRGLRVRLPVLRREGTKFVNAPSSGEYEDHEYLGILNCRLEDEFEQTLALRLQKRIKYNEYNVSCGYDLLDSSRAGPVYDPARIVQVRVDLMPAVAPQLVEIARKSEDRRSPVTFWFRLSRNGNLAAHGTEYFPSHNWNEKGTIVRAFFSDHNYSSNEDEEDVQEEEVIVAGVRLSIASARVTIAFGCKRTATGMVLPDVQAVSEFNPSQGALPLAGECRKLLSWQHSRRTKKLQKGMESSWAFAGIGYQITASLRQASVMEEAVYIIDAHVRQQVDLETLAELDATERSGSRPDPMKDYNVRGVQSRLDAWVDAKALDNHMHEMLGSFTTLMYRLTPADPDSWEWDERVLWAPIERDGNNLADLFPVNGVPAQQKLLAIGPTELDGNSLASVFPVNGLFVEESLIGLGLRELDGTEVSRPWPQQERDALAAAPLVGAWNAARSFHADVDAVCGVLLRLVITHLMAVRELPASAITHAFDTSFQPGTASG